MSLAVIVSISTPPPDRSHVFREPVSVITCVYKVIMYTKAYKAFAFFIFVVVCKSELLDIQGLYKAPSDYKREKSDCPWSEPCGNPGTPSELTPPYAADMLYMPGHFPTNSMLENKDIPESYWNNDNRIVKPAFDIAKNDLNNENKKKLRVVVKETKRYRRVKRQESTKQSLYNDENQRANIVKIFGPKTEFERAQEELNLNSTKYENVLDPAELQRTIEIIFGPVPPSLAQTKDTTNAESQPSLKPNNNLEAAMTVEQPSLQTLILQNFGPEVISDDNTNKLEKTDKHIEESTTTDVVPPTTVPETTPKIPNNCQNIQTSLFVYVVYTVALILFFV